MASGGSPIFLHSSWRTGSTYLWAKFRARADTCCYFEPLTEHLATATPAFVDGFAPWAYANHPRLDAPYLEEFRPLLAACGGVPGFPAHLTYGRFRCDRGADLPELKAYFETLGEHARRLGKTAVFGCVRTDLRLDWFQAHLPGIHILIRRDPRRRFISCLTQAVNGNTYFLERGHVILGNNCYDPAFAHLREALDVSNDGARSDLGDDAYARQAWSTEWSSLYAISYFLHGLVDRSLSADTVDLSVDMDRLSGEPSARAETEQAIEALTGMAISLGDCRIERYDKHLSWSAPFFAEIEAKIDVLLDDSP